MYKYFIDHTEIEQDPKTKFFSVDVRVELGDTFVYFTKRDKKKSELLSKILSKEYMQKWIKLNFDNI